MVYFSKLLQSFDLLKLHCLTHSAMVADNLNSELKSTSNGSHNVEKVSRFILPF